MDKSRLEQEEKEFREWFDASEREIEVLKARVRSQIYELKELLTQLLVVLD